MKKFISKKKINQRVKFLAKKISKDYKGKELVVVGVLNGSFIFMADLIREIKGVEVTIDFIQVISYRGTESTGKPILTRELSKPVKNKHVLIVEDIVDTGLTLGVILDFIGLFLPLSIKVCSLLDKPDWRVLSGLVIDYLGFTVPDKFIIGYGLDFDGKYRNLPNIEILQKALDL